jgi:hypothetical protein
MQLFALDARQERQYADYADDNVLAFARANPGRLYINGDEPDQYCVKPMDYAVWYHDFVQGVRAADPTARFSPAGFAEPNYKCCPLPDDVYASCWALKHSVLYAQDFYNAYVERYGVRPPVDEWRFHSFGLRYGPGEIDAWWYEINNLAQWSIEHGANMVLGSWGFMGWRPGDESTYIEWMKQAMNRLMNDSRINGAVYWSWQQWLGNPHYLVNSDGSLTEVGLAYINPLTDVPSSPAIVDADNAQAQLLWTNTTRAWSAEVEFWVQVPGTNDFVYSKTERVDPGVASTSLNTFSSNANVKGRVRYYNAYGQAAWSPFSAPARLDGKAIITRSSTFRPCIESKRIATPSCS